MLNIRFENDEDIKNQICVISLRRKCLYSELFWSVLSSILKEYGGIRSSSLYSVQMQKNRDQNNSEYGHFSRSVCNKS